jgi:hypothetical protein
MRAFVIRPFRQKEDIDFAKVHRRLIGPALQESGYVGNTTEAIIEAGSIHEDMFLELVGAELVIADVSVHNANVFYELGIRHALRPRSTVLLRARATADQATKRADVPFDIHGFRYCEYDSEQPEAALNGLVASIRQTAAAHRVDSPVYRLLPDLMVDADKLRRIPFDLAEQIEQASRAGSSGDLRLLAEDVTGMRFEEPALRRIAGALAEVGDRYGAIRTWERVRVDRPNDYQANHSLATLYARQPEPDAATRSEQAIVRAFDNPGLTDEQRTELHALRGSNLKDLWMQYWRPGGSPPERQRRALRSTHLDDAITAYATGFEGNLDSYYAGLNMVALGQLQLRLAAAHPDVWRTNHRSDDEADDRLRARTRQIERLTMAVGAALEAKVASGRSDARPDPWLEVSLADYQFLTCDELERVVAGYERAVSGLRLSQRVSVTRQLRLFADLGIRDELAVAALAAVHPPARDATEEGRRGVEALVFSGHMLDRDPDAEERFPARLEPTVAAAIEEKLRGILADAQADGRELRGMAAASDGGDILFHEACAKLGVTTEVYLPVPDELYRATALAPGSEAWVPRYFNVLGGRRVHTLNPMAGLPSWVDLRRDTSSWPRFNQWILHHAAVIEQEARVTVLVLWDGKPSRGPGGVSHMVQLAQQRGARVVPIPMDDLRAGD